VKSKFISFRKNKNSRKTGGENKLRKIVVKGLLALGAVLLLSTGCGIFTGKNGAPSSGTSGYTGQTGSLVFHVVWPVKAVKSRTIPADTALVEIEVTGEGMAQARKETITPPTTQKRIDGLPIGQKGVTATAKDNSGKPLAIGYASVIVEPGVVKDVTIELRPIQQSQIDLARAMVQDVRDAGVAISSGISQEIASQLSVFTLDIIPTYALTLQRLDFLNTVLSKVYLDTGGEVPEGPHHLTGIPPAKYQARIEQWWDPWLNREEWIVVLKKIGDAPAANTWVVNFPESDALVSGMQLTFKYTGSSDNNYEVAPWEFNVTSSSESQLDYHGSLVLETDSQKHLTKATVNGSFKDKYLPDGITVQGILTGTPYGQKSYTLLSFSGSITSRKISLSVDNAVANFQPPSQDEKYWGHWLTSATLTNLKFKTQNVAEPIEITGNLSVEADVSQATQDKGPLIKKGNFTGTYVSNNSTFEGSISFDWQNPERKRLQNTPLGTASVTGKMAVINRPVFTTSFTLKADNPGAFTVAIDITRGNHYLRGAMNGAWEVVNGRLEVTDWSVDLKNENSIELQFSKSSNGGVIYGSDGSKVADVQKDPDLKLLLVRYVDGTIESLQPASFSFSPVSYTGTVTGRVIDATTNQPIKGAWVESGIDEVMTDINGRFELRAIAGHQTLWIWADGYEEGQIEVVVPVHGTVDAGDIALQPSPGIFGTVKDTAGIPIPWAQVLLIQNNQIVETTWTNPEGEYGFSNVPAGTYIVGVSAAGYQDALREVTLHENEHLVVDFVLQPGGGGGGPVPPAPASKAKGLVGVRGR
jgi:hypothetical protein